MKKTWIWCMIAGFVFLGAIALIIVLVKNWESISECMDKCKEKTGKIANKLKGDDNDYEPGEYLEI